MICKRIVEQLHGRISVTSEPNRGTTFLFTAKVEVKCDFENYKDSSYMMHTDEFDHGMTVSQKLEDYINSFSPFPEIQSE